jgi:hypothetical protein
VRFQAEFVAGAVVRLQIQHAGWRLGACAAGDRLRQPDADATSDNAVLATGFRFMNSEMPPMAASINALIDRAMVAISLS